MSRELAKLETLVSRDSNVIPCSGPRFYGMQERSKRCQRQEESNCCCCAIQIEDPVKSQNLTWRGAGKRAVACEGWHWRGGEKLNTVI